MAELHVPEPLEFVRELAMEVELRPDVSEADIAATVDLMNRVVEPAGFGGFTIVTAAAAYELPTHDADVEMLTEEDVLRARILDVMARGRFDCIMWFGSMSMRGFGVRMFGVDFYRPDRGVAEALFVPIETLDMRIHAA